MSREKEIKVSSSEEGEAVDARQDGVDDAAEATGERAGDTPGSAPVDSEAPPAEPTPEEKIASLEDKLLRTMADFENYRRRTANQYEQTIRAANDRLLLDILEVVDNFERALQHAREAADAESLRKGTELIYNQLVDLLGRYNLTPIEAVGQSFDPNLHDAMMQTPSEKHAPGTVAFEITKGYRMGDRVLRHSRVAVSTGPPDTGESSDESNESQT